MSDPYESRGPELVAVCATFASLAVLSVLLRVYVRVFLVKAFGWDDGFMVLALAFQLMFAISAIIGVYWGTGRHMSVLSPEQITNALRYWYYCYPAYCLSMICAKISIGIFLLRVTVQPLYRRIIYGVMGATVVTGLVFFFISVLQCRPVQFFWEKFTMTGTCVDINVIIGIAYAYSAVASICDLTFGLLPIFLVWGLNMPRNQRMMLIPILGMGCVASVAVTVRMGYLVQFKNPDFLWGSLNIAIWSDIEQGLAITAGSLATLRPLYRSMSTWLGLSDPGASGKGGTSDRKGSHKWYKTPSNDLPTKSGPFSLRSMTKPGVKESRMDYSSTEDLRADLESQAGFRQRDDLIDERDRKSFASWKIQAGDGEEKASGSQGITRQTDVFLDRGHGNM